MPTTDIEIRGANCPTCFDDTLRALRALDGVAEAGGSLAGQQITVRHDLAPEAVDAVLAVVREHLHADAVFGLEHVLAPVDAGVTACDCTHHRSDP